MAVLRGSIGPAAGPQLAHPQSAVQGSGGWSVGRSGGAGDGADGPHVSGGPLATLRGPRLMVSARGGYSATTAPVRAVSAVSSSSDTSDRAQLTTGFTLPDARRRTADRLHSGHGAHPRAVSMARRRRVRTDASCSGRPLPRRAGPSSGATRRPALSDAELRGRLQGRGRGGWAGEAGRGSSPWRVGRAGAEAVREARPARLLARCTGGARAGAVLGTSLRHVTRRPVTDRYG